MIDARGLSDATVLDPDGHRVRLGDRPRRHPWPEADSCSGGALKRPAPSDAEESASIAPRGGAVSAPTRVPP
jgi:hypothetical protein